MCVIVADLPSLLPTFLVRRSRVELQARRPDLALADANKALGILQAENQPRRHSSNVGRAYLALAHSLKGQGNASEAQVASRTALENLQDISDVQDANPDQLVGNISGENI